jgi:YlmC/YmxH family sporulation protein
VSRASDFRQKEVINLTDGKRLGFVYDVEINMENGKVEAIIVPGSGKLLGLFGRDTDYVIPWQSIKRVGEDIILINMDEKALTD